MSKYEIGSDKPLAPSVSFLYGNNGEVVGEMAPMYGPVVEAFTNGDITAEEYFRLATEEAAANQRLCGFMYGDQSPDFMPEILRTPRWYSWLKDIVNEDREKG
jgi:hypothetical protein